MLMLMKREKTTARMRWTVDNLGADDDGATLQEECEVAGEVEASCEPPALGNVQLRAALVGEGAQVEDGVLEGHRVEGDAVTNGPELGDRHAVRPRRRGRAAPRALWLRLRTTSEAEYRDRDRHRQCQSHLHPPQQYSEATGQCSVPPLFP